MKNRGFTLLELLGVIVILALLTTLVFPSILNVIKKSSDQTDKFSMDLISNAADLYIENHANDFKKRNGSRFIIDINELLEEGNLPSNIKISDIDNIEDKCVQATYINNKYSYELKNKGTCTIMPQGYQQVEYIESKGTQYIDTEIIPNQDTGFDIVFLTKNEISGVNGEYGSIMGARLNSGKSEFQLTTYSSGSSFLGTLRFGSESKNAGIAINTKIRSTLINQTYTNNSNVELAFTQSFTSPVTLTVFALNNNGSIVQHGTLRLYNLKLYDVETLIRNFVPCYRESDGVIGLYDLVEDKFYINQGTGNFDKGKDI